MQEKCALLQFLGAGKQNFPVSGRACGDSFFSSNDEKIIQDKFRREFLFLFFLR